MHSIHCKSLFLILATIFLASYSFIQEPALYLSDGNYRLKVELIGMKMEIQDRLGTVKVPKDQESGLFLNGHPVISSEVLKSSSKSAKLKVSLSNGAYAQVDLVFKEGRITLNVSPQNDNINTTSIRFGGMPVAYGLGDAGGWNKTFNLVAENEKRFRLINDGARNRWVSSFCIFPKNDFAGVFFSQGKKSVTLSTNSYHQEIEGKGASSFYLFVGKVPELYKHYKNAREDNGYSEVKPKFTLFELGWESWDALGWNTNEETVKGILAKFLKEGYPIKWAVTGSGFWDQGGTTTSFGRWGEKFPEPQSLKNWMGDNDIHWMIGLRTNFIPQGGPYFPKTTKRDKNLKVNSFYGNELSEVGLNKGYFVKDIEGVPFRITSSIFPIVPSYLLDGRNKKAAKWYGALYKKWEVAGIKEDTMMDLDSLIGIFNQPIKNISDDGGLVMARNGAFVSPGTLLRINDSGVGEKNSRIPINYFQFAASGFPNVYSDVAGVHNMHNLAQVSSNIEHAWLLALTAGMAIGAFPEGWPEEARNTFKKLVNFHYQLGPYLYSSAIKAYHSGFPYTLTPLPLAFPGDDKVYQQQRFEWMIGESILAAPLLSEESIEKVAVYLPDGIWYDFESGEKFVGPKLLDNYPHDLNKVPVFIGGKGVIILRKDASQNIAHVYPTSSLPVSYVHHFGENKRDAQINVINKGIGTPKVLGKSGQEIDFHQDNISGKVTFRISPGTDYKVIF
ncbi:hypothetical protein GCM10027284_08080 [Cyclobacterium sediminis]